MEREEKIVRSRRLFGTFFKIGAFTFGGGYAMIPLIQREAVEKNHWIEEKDILDIVAVAESTPGPIAVNAATFVGYHTAGLPGAVCATLGVVFPAFAVILILSSCLRWFEHLQAVKYAFNGIRAGVLALIVKALFSMGKECPKEPAAYLIAAAAFAGTVVFDLSVMLVIAVSALAGLICTCVGKAGRRSL